MRTGLLRSGCWCLLFLLQGRHLFAQDDRREYPSLVSRGLFELNIGHIDFPFSQSQLEPGHRVETVDVPNLGVRLSLGYRFSDYLSAQLTYMRPVRWVQYSNLDGDRSSHSVWMNVTGATLKSRLPVGHALSLYGEGGLGVVTRHGFDIDGSISVRDAVYAAPLLGAGLEYRPGKTWGVAAGVVYLPANRTPPQPHTVFYSGGLTYKVGAPSIRSAPDAGRRYIFPKRLIQIGYSTSAFGYGLNTLVSPVFWQGDVDVERGVTVHYQRNIFHTEKMFSLDWGASAAVKDSRQRRDRFVALSIFPLFRFTALRTRPADLYVSYSLGGPTFISRVVIDGQETGKRFTFQDLLGVGIYAGANRHINAEIRVGHYSNGNLIPRNPGIKVPLTFNLGYAF